MRRSLSPPSARSCSSNGADLAPDLCALAVAFAARTSVGDPPFIHNDKRLAEIPTRKFAAAVRANITDVRCARASLPAAARDASLRACTVLRALQMA